MPRVYLPGRQGSLQPEIVATARAYGRVAYPIDAALEALLIEIAAGHPVLVLQNLGLGIWPAWHYAVVVGYDAGRDVLILRSGTEERLLIPTRRFARSWRLAHNWGLVIAHPDQPPATARMAAWLSAASAFEELGRPEVAGAAYQAATVRWPAEPLGWQLLGNARYSRGDLPGAEDALRASLGLEDSAATRNNLAYVLMVRGCPGQARAEVARALDSGPDEATRAVLLRTRGEIDAWRGIAARDCGPGS